MYKQILIDNIDVFRKKAEARLISWGNYGIRTQNKVTRQDMLQHFREEFINERLLHWIQTYNPPPVVDDNFDVCADFWSKVIANLWEATYLYWLRSYRHSSKSIF